MKFNRHKIIYCDLDGVLANWTKRVASIFDIEDLPLRIPDGLYPWFGDSDDSRREELNLFMEEYVFWKHLSPYSYAKDLVEIAKRYGEVYILTKARPNSGCTGGKMDWIIKYFPELENRLIITTQDKFVCSGPDRMLVDDDLRHKDQWEKFGGTFFHWEELLDCKENEIEIKNRLTKLETSLFLFKST